MAGMDTMQELVAAELRAMLARKRVSAAALARRLGWSQTYMARRVDGRAEPTLTELQQIAEALGVEVAELLPRHVRAVTPEYSRLAERWTATARPRRGSTRPASKRPAVKTIGPPNVPDGSRRPTLIPRRIGA